MSLGDSEWAFAHDHLETPELLPVQDDNRWVLVHGMCLYAGPDQRKMSPAERLAEAAALGDTEFLDMLDVLGGRHIVLLGNKDGFSLYQDAIGMRSVYFSTSAEILTSHANLLNELSSHQKRTPEQGLNAFMRAWERTPYLGIDALLPNHSLTVPRFDIKRFFPREINRFRRLSIQERIDALRTLWDRQWESLMEIGPDLVMSVTGGNDSRTTLALLAEHVHSIETFTYTTAKPANSPREASLKLDKKIVDQIKSCIALNHKYIVEPEKRADLDEHLKSTLAKNTIGTHGRWLLPYYLQSSGHENSLHIRGNAYGVYKLAWLPLNNKDTLDDLRKQYFRLTKNDQPHETPASREKQFFDGIELWEYSGRQFDYHRSEILFWELRLGRWASEIYNETDIAFNSLEPTNVRKILEIATSFTYAEKRNKLFQSELVNDAYPLLNFPGKNDLRNLYEQIRDRDAGVSNTERDKLHDSETVHGLQPDAVLTLEDGTQTEMKLPAGEIKIPAEHFRPGRSVARSFVPSEIEGDLTFTVTNPYSNPQAQGTWAFEVLVDDESKFRWDGADRHRPVHVSVQNLRVGMGVTVREVALRDQQGKTSWERASRATITSSIAQQRPVQGQVTVIADIVSERVP
ncbi:hypothetical protein IEE92_02350 [Kocuria sp. cx-116]|uniref:hypothetical protein n=1 Tax=Kocuria sp. cx-116 TaxID=2771378 RepID=UPI0016873848|nr:hypothetical protein [Kocuria sp. cx-116]MBD2761402.1 hypothetical protein [Kocuria sp. cx-116]